MATAPADLLLQLDQNLILQLKEIVRSDLDFDKLSDTQKKALLTAALAVGFSTDLAAFISFKEHPELLGLPPRSKEAVETATVNAQVLAVLVADLENKETLDQRIDSVFKNRSEKDRARIKQILRMLIVREQARVLTQKADLQNQGLIGSVRNAADPKGEQHPAIRQTAEEIINASVAQIKTSYTPTQIDEAVNTLATATIAGLVNFTDPVSSNTAIQVALSSNREYQTTITAIVHQIETNLSLTPDPNYESATITQASPNVSVSLNKISLPAAEIEPEIVGLTLSPPIQDRAEKAQAVAVSFSEKIAAGSQADPVIAALIGTITPEQEKELARILISQNLVARIAPTREGSAAATTIERLNPVNPFADASTIRFISMGLDIKSVEKHLAEKPASKLADFVHQNPNVLRQLRIGSQHLENLKNDLGKEISDRLRTRAAENGVLPSHLPAPTQPGPLSAIAAQYQSLTNRLSGFLPGRAGQIFNAAAHPLQFIQGKIGNFIGNRIADHFKNWVAKKVVSRIANETLKKGAEFILKKGLQEGIKLLAKEGLKRGLQALAQVANIAPGAGLLLAAAIEVGSWLLEKTFGLVQNTINSLSRALTGEDFDWRAAAAAPLALLAGIGGVIGSLGAAASVAAASAGVVLIASTIVGFFLYIVVIAIAPIITTIAHLESGLGPQQGPLFGGIYEPYTGPILPGCPQIWPFPGGYVIQGPHGIYSHASVEAVDIYTNIGTPVKSVSSGSVTVTGWGDAYGNWIQVRSTTQSGKSYVVLYAHLSEIGVQVGDPVGVGTVIALSGASSSVPGFANPHLHLEYYGLAYNSCPAGGIQIPEGCYSAVIGKPNACLIGGQPIYTN